MTPVNAKHQSIAVVRTLIDLRRLVTLARFSAQRQDSTESNEGQQDQDQDGLRVIAHVAS
jgi:hypothetical protein